jgi:hypothetical protein
VTWYRVEQNYQTFGGKYEVASINSRTEAIAKYPSPNKLMWKLPTSTQLRVTWYTDSLDMVVLLSTCASRYHNCCIDSVTSPEYIVCTLVYFRNIRNPTRSRGFLNQDTKNGPPKQLTVSHRDAFHPASLLTSSGVQQHTFSPQKFSRRYMEL